MQSRAVMLIKLNEEKKDIKEIWSQYYKYKMSILRNESFLMIFLKFEVFEKLEEMFLMCKVLVGGSCTDICN